MDHEANPYHHPAGPAPQPPASRWKVPRVAATVGLTAFLGMAGAGVAFAVGGNGGSATSPAAASSSGSSGGSAPAAPPAGRPGGFGPHRHLGPMGGGPGAVVHGIYTVRSGTGYKTEQMQVGTVQSGSSSTSLIVKSVDNYSQTYTVTSSTVVDSEAGGISTVKPGDRVRVEAVQQGSSYTATDVVDMTRISSSRTSFGFAPPARPAAPQAPSSPNGSAA